MRYSHIFPYSEAFDSAIHTHLGVGKKGLVSCLSSSQRDFNVLWFELSLALGRDSHRHLKVGGQCFVGFSEPFLTGLQKCNSFSEQMGPNWYVPCFPGELFIPKIKGPKEVCPLIHRLMNCPPWCLHVCLGNRAGGVRAKDPKTFVSGGDWLCFWAQFLDLGLHGILSWAVVSADRELP